MMEVLHPQTAITRVEIAPVVEIVLPTPLIAAARRQVETVSEIAVVRNHLGVKPLLKKPLLRRRQIGHASGYRNSRRQDRLIGRKD
jgi:hypothetical protein